MITLKGKDDYELLYVDYDLWCSSDNRYTNDFLYKPWLDNEYELASVVSDKPIYKALKDTDGKTMRAVIEKSDDYNHYVFHQGDKLFFHKGCTIPRARGEGLWQRVIKQSKADAIVVPEPKKITLMENAALFTNEQCKKIYVVSHLQHIDAPFDIGTTLMQVLNDNKDNIHHDFFDYNSASVADSADAVCTYKGNIMFYNIECQWLIDMFEGPYQKTIFEDELIQAIGTDEQRLSLEVAESIMTMLRSKDVESVHAGMRALAHMDYANYPSITRWILSETSKNWQSYTPFNSDVKFMLNTIDFKHKQNVPFAKVTATEFDLTKDMFASIINRRLNNTINALREMTNMRLDISFDVSIFLDGTSLGKAPVEAIVEEEQIDKEEDSVDKEENPIDENEDSIEDSKEEIDNDDTTLEKLLPDNVQLELLFM